MLKQELRITVPASYRERRVAYSSEESTKHLLVIDDLITNIMDHVMDREVSELNYSYINHDFDIVEFNVTLTGNITSLKSNRQIVESQVIMEFI